MTAMPCGSSRPWRIEVLLFSKFVIIALLKGDEGERSETADEADESSFDSPMASASRCEFDEH
jgi:hypothetical protein